LGGRWGFITLARKSKKHMIKLWVGDLTRWKEKKGFGKGKRGKAGPFWGGRRKGVAFLKK